MKYYPACAKGVNDAKGWERREMALQRQRKPQQARLDAGAFHRPELALFDVRASIGPSWISILRALSGRGEGRLSTGLARSRAAPVSGSPRPLYTNPAPSKEPPSTGDVEANSSDSLETIGRWDAPSDPRMTDPVARLPNFRWWPNRQKLGRNA